MVKKSETILKLLRVPMLGATEEAEIAWAQRPFSHASHRKEVRLPRYRTDLVDER